jgi:cysteine-rich repeat protein
MWVVRAGGRPGARPSCRRWQPLAAWLSLLVALSPAARTRAQSCTPESSCSFKKPNILLVLDYSSSMTGAKAAPAYFPPGQKVTTRWIAELDAASWILRYDQGFFADNARIGLTRFGHDPDLAHPGTTIKTDVSFPAITDGFAIDVPFDGSDDKYLECKSSGIQAAVDVLRTTPPPPIDGLSIDSLMLTWTRGALRSAHDLIGRTRQQHQNEAGESARDYEVVLMTDGDWTCPDMIGQNCDENPAPEAAKLRADGVPVHVIAFGDATMTPSLNEIALQGGTGKSIDAVSPQGIVDAFSGVLDGIRNGVIVPTCTQKLPRMLVIMDASTSMIEGNAPGATKWDKARFALAGNPSAPNPGDAGYVEPVLAHKLNLQGREVAIEDLVHLGMVAFAGPTEQTLMANFGPCMRDNFAWAMDPATSCKAPGCKDPYGGSPLSWTFQDSDSDRTPAFVRTTHSYLPLCRGTGVSKSCGGDEPTTFTGQGLEFAHKVISDYQHDSAPFAANSGTRYLNVLITDGQTSDGSSDVQAALSSMVSAGIDTYVIGFGSDDELDSAQLEQYAIWGNTQHALLVDPSQPDSSAKLADSLASVVSGLGLDACCVLNDCAADPEPANPSPVCGDGRIEGDETCDDGPLNATYGHCGGRCMGLHLFCGDGRVDGPEQCDDGNQRSHDGCDPRCMKDVDDSDAGTMTDAADSGSRVGDVPQGTSAARAGASAPRTAADSAGRGATTQPSAADAGAQKPSAAAAHGCGCNLPGQAPARLPSVWFAWLLPLSWLIRRRSGARRPR